MRTFAEDQRQQASDDAPPLANDSDSVAVVVAGLERVTGQTGGGLYGMDAPAPVMIETEPGQVAEAEGGGPEDVSFAFGLHRAGQHLSTVAALSRATGPDYLKQTPPELLANNLNWLRQDLDALIGAESEQTMREMLAAHVIQCEKLASLFFQRAASVPANKVDAAYKLASIGLAAQKAQMRGMSALLTLKGKALPQVEARGHDGQA